MWYIIIAILIIVTNVLMYNVGKRVGKMLIAKIVVWSVDRELLSQRDCAEVLKNIMVNVKNSVTPSQKDDPTPINRGIIKEIDNEYILRNRKTGERCGHPYNKRSRADDNSKIHHSNQQDEER